VNALSPLGRAVMSLLLVLLASAAPAHDLGIASVSLWLQSEGRVTLTAKLPSKIHVSAPELPEQCQQLHKTGRELSVGIEAVQWTYACDKPLRNTDSLIFPWPREGVFVSLKTADGSLRPGQFFIEDEGAIPVPLQTLLVAPRGMTEVAGYYLDLGVEHILTGWDHLAFVYLLCLIATGRQLVKLITAFTLGHSVTLVCAALELVTLAIPPVEACIAISIVLVARQQLLPPKAQRHGLGLVFAFGLLHGLGFASALGEVGLAQEHLLLGLVTFNLGVELGQLLFVGGFLLAVYGLSRLKLIERLAGLKPVPAYLIGSLGIFWFVDRVSPFMLPSGAF